MTGDLMFVAGGALWATYTVVARHRRVDPLHAAALVSVISMALYVPAYLMIRTPTTAVVPARDVLIQAVFQGVFAAVLALVFHTKAVAILGIGRGALFPAFVPGLAVLLAYPALGEVPSLPQLAGLTVVTLGMVGAIAAPQRGSERFQIDAIRPSGRLSDR